MKLRLASGPLCHGFSQKPGLGLRPVGRGEEICGICTRRPPGRRAGQTVLFVCAVVSVFLGRKNGPPRPKNRDPRDLRTRDNGESISVAHRRPAALKPGESTTREVFWRSRLGRAGVRSFGIAFRSYFCGFARFLFFCFFFEWLRSSLRGVLCSVPGSKLALSCGGVKIKAVRTRPSATPPG